MKPYGVFCGELVRASDLTSKSGKRYIALTVEGSAVSYGEGKSFRPKVEVACYRNQDNLMAIPMGTQVVCTGEIEARTFEHNGKTYAALKMMGMAEPILGAAPPAPFPTAPVRRPPSPVQTELKAGADEDDDVPF